jgi:DNA-binding CsgD family transcriptional regulator/PAS domain-containing protein
MHRALDELNDLIALIYETALDRHLWPRVTDRLADLTGARVCQISICDGTTQKVVDVAPRVPPESLQDYEKYWVHHNPQIAAGRSKPVGAVLSVHDLIPRASLLRLPIYGEFFGPLGLEEKLGAKLIDDDTGWAAFGVWRPARLGPFGRSVASVLAAVVPHLQRAMQLNIRLADVEMVRTASAEILDQLNQAVLLVDAASRVLFANRTAETILSERPGLYRNALGILNTSVDFETALLRKLVDESARPPVDGEAGSGGQLRVSRGNLRAPLTVLVVPLRTETDWLQSRRPMAMLFVTDPERANLPTTANLRLNFGLTRTEAAMAIEVLNGGSVKAAAARLGIAPTTARTHLSAVFDKTNTRRQPDLVRLLLQSGSVFGGVCNSEVAGSA